MNVTRKNFLELLPKILKQIQKCEFVSVDLEFCGLPHPKSYNKLDTREDRYRKISKSIEKFFIPQYGLSIFSKTQNGYTSYTYNFFLSPVGPVNEDRSSRRYEILGSTINFLCEHNFDFNTAFGKGVRFMSVPEEAKFKKRLDEKRERIRAQCARKQNNDDSAKLDRERLVAEYPAETIALLDEYKKRIEEFLMQDDKNSLNLPPCNSYIRRLIYMTLKPEFAGKTQFISGRNENNEPVVTILKTIKTEEEVKLAEVDAEEEAMKEKLGFLHILRVISVSKTPLVFHAGELDLYLTMKHFFCDELPETLEEFKSITTATFPQIFDTLLMSRNEPLKSNFPEGNSLGEIFKKVQDQPFALNAANIHIADGYRDYKAFGGQVHEAGYDAWMTGVAFIHMMGYLNLVSKTKTEAKLTQSAVSKIFKNRYSISGMYDIHHISLDRSDNVPKRNHCFHLSFPATWRQHDIYELFRVCGRIRVMWIDDGSAFVAIEDHSAVNLVNSIKKDPEYCISTYQEWKATQESGAPPTPKKRKISEPEVVSACPKTTAMKDLTLQSTPTARKDGVFTNDPVCE